MSNIRAVREVFRFFERCQIAESQGGISPAHLMESLGLLLGDGVDRHQLELFLQDLTSGRAPNSMLHIREVVQSLEVWFNSAEAERIRLACEGVPVHISPLPPKPRAQNFEAPWHWPPDSPSSKTFPQRAMESPRSEKEIADRTAEKLMPLNKPCEPVVDARLQSPPSGIAAAPASVDMLDQETPRPVLRARCTQLEEELDATRAAVRQLLHTKAHENSSSPHAAAHGINVPETQAMHKGSTSPAGEEEEEGEEEDGELVPNSYLQQYMLRMQKAARQQEAGGLLAQAQEAQLGGPQGQQEPGPTERENALLKQVLSLQEQVQMARAENQGLEMLIAEESRNSARKSEAASRAAQAKAELERRFADRGSALEHMSASFKLVHEQLEGTLGAVAKGGDVVRGATEALAPIAGALQGLQEVVQRFGELEKQVSVVTYRLQREVQAREKAEQEVAQLKSAKEHGHEEHGRLAVALGNALAECARMQDRAAAAEADANRSRAVAGAAQAALGVEQNARRSIEAAANKSREALERRQAELEAALLKKAKEAHAASSSPSQPTNTPTSHGANNASPEKAVLQDTGDAKGDPVAPTSSAGLSPKLDLQLRPLQESQLGSGEVAMAVCLAGVARSATAVEEGIHNLDCTLEKWAAVLPQAGRSWPA